jgi:hypothetical protein
MKLYFQGDLCIEQISDVEGIAGLLPPAPDGAVVLAEGEVTGHRHAFYGGGVTLFRDDALAREVPRELYIGILKVEADEAALRHEEHDTIVLAKGTYRVRQQREFDGSDVIVDRTLRLLRPGTMPSPLRGRVVLD